jgi:TRAP-type C4-dicarboxylate transport system permease small subunit
MRTIVESIPVKLLHGLMALLNAAGTAWIAVITVLITCDILGRVLFNSPIIGVPEIVKVSVVAIVWLQMSYTLKIGGHIRSDVILDRLSPRGRAFVDLIASILGAFVFGLLVYAGWHNMIEAWRIGEFEGELPVRVPTYPVRTIVLLGAALTSFQFVLFGWQSALKVIGRAKGEGR